MTDQERIEKAKELIAHAESIVADMDATDDFYVSSIQDIIANLLADLNMMVFDDSGNVISDDEDGFDNADPDEDWEEDDDFDDEDEDFDDDDDLIDEF